MSDGPWRSLPLRQHWKQVARQAEIRASSPEELSGALETALQKEAAALPLEAVCRAVVPDGQGSLFKPDLNGELEALQRGHPGSKVVQTLVTCLLDEESSGSSGSELVESAVADMLDEYARDYARAIAEHYYRKSRSPTIPVDRRLASAHRLCDFRRLASRLVAPPGSSASSPGPVKTLGA